MTTFDDADLREQFLLAAAKSQSVNDPRGAAELLGAAVGKSNSGWNEAVIKIADRWAADDSREAVEQLSAVADKSNSGWNEAVIKIADRCAAGDPRQAAETLTLGVACRSSEFDDVSSDCGRHLLLQ